MANTPSVGLRVPTDLADEARAHIGQPDAPLSLLVKAGLGVLAGYALKDALASAQPRRGPKPQGSEGA